VSGHDVVLQWSPPPGLTPDGYVVEAGAGATAADVAATSLVSDAPGLAVRGVPKGTYWVRVRAVIDGVAGNATAAVGVVVP
jgi:hypothetical protein